MIRMDFSFQFSSLSNNKSVWILFDTWICLVRKSVSLPNMQKSKEIQRETRMPWNSTPSNSRDTFNYAKHISVRKIAVTLKTAVKVVHYKLRDTYFQVLNIYWARDWQDFTCNFWIVSFHIGPSSLTFLCHDSPWCSHHTSELWRHCAGDNSYSTTTCQMCHSWSLVPARQTGRMLWTDASGGACETVCSSPVWLAVGRNPQLVWSSLPGDEETLCWGIFLRCSRLNWSSL